MRGIGLYLFAAATLAGLVPAGVDAGDMGTFTLDSRLRFETAEVTGLEDAENFSLRLRPGFRTPDFHGVSAMAEGEFTWPFDKDAYNAAGVHGNPDKAVIADPENAQLDQLWVSYKQDDLLLKGGRQVIALDNHRWIGHVGWRQNRQTYDAALLTVDPVENLTLLYSWVGNVVRIFGSDAPSSGANAEEFGSNSHLINAAYNAGQAGKFTAFAYFLDLDDAPGKIAGSDTFGVSYQGTCRAIEDVPMGLYLEYARQSDAGDNVQEYDADYFHANGSAAYKGLKLTAGYELLGSDRAGVDEEGAAAYASVKTPLATLHKFNGFADVFLVTPDQGLEDTYVSLAYTLPLNDTVGPITAQVWYHDFQSHKQGLDLGDEFDAVLIKPIPAEGLPGKLKAVFKYADYSAGDTGSDTKRLSIELNWSMAL